MHISIYLKIAIWRWQTPQLPRPEKAQNLKKERGYDNIQDLGQVTY